MPIRKLVVWRDWARHLPKRNGGERPASQWLAAGVREAVRRHVRPEPLMAKVIITIRPRAVKCCVAAA